MEFIILLIILVILYVILFWIFDVNYKRLKKIGEDKSLNYLVQKYPDNIEICKEYLKKLNNENVKIEENKNSSSTLYLIMSNKIFIADLKESYTRIQTIAHECLHSIQSKKLLWFNFIFSNVYLIFFAILSILAIFKLVKYKMLLLTIFLLFGLAFFSVRAYLENDAMIKARFLAKEYIEEKKISSKEDINKIIDAYDKLNDVGIKCINFNLLSGIILKVIVLLAIFIIF